jgi:transposase
MAKQTRKTRSHSPRSKNSETSEPKTGRRAKTGTGKTLVTHSLGAMPILRRLLQRMRLHEFLRQHLPAEDRRTRVDTARVLMLLVTNVLISREPMYGVAEWAREFDPDLFDLRPDQIERLNDDRVGRCLERIFAALDTPLIMDLVTHVVGEFDLSLDELHNDSTTVSFFGDYPDAESEQMVEGHSVPAITWGHSKDHRPDLKQLLYILTVSNDGGVPIYFQTASGNVVDDQTHITTWRLLKELAGRADFVYVADCKLATTEQMNEIARQQGRFITVLPATRKENSQFRKRLVESCQTVSWHFLYEKVTDRGDTLDVFSVCTDEQVSKEGYRLLWYHSRRKQETDAATRARRVQRTLADLTTLRKRLGSPRTRFRGRDKVQTAIDEILTEYAMSDFVRIAIMEVEEETYRQTKRGRPGKNTKYTREVRMRYDITWEVDQNQLERVAAGDGVFPLLTNLPDWTATEVLDAYKRQPIIEKRFSQLKTDFRVAPVYLKDVRRIVGLLTVYFFALMLQALLERELRQAMGKSEIESLPLYPENRRCFRPTTRRVLDLFAPISRHTFPSSDSSTPECLTTELTRLHRQILRLLSIPRTDYAS